MAAISFQGKTTFVRQFVAAVQAAANAVVDASVGSVTLALAQAVAGVALWLQAFVAQVLLLTRASTSIGTDLDSWMADWSFVRLPAVAATGQATFARATPTLQAVVPIGQLISTGPGGEQFAVTIDLTNPAYNAGLGGYVLAAGIASVIVPVAAAIAGTSGNVSANTIISFVSPVPGVDTVTNASALSNGQNAESDAAFRSRFIVYLAGLATADKAAISSAIANVQTGIAYTLVENFDYPGTTPDNGNFFVVIDDGSGNPPASLITAVQNAINAIRGFTIRFTVNGPTVVVPAISLSIRVASGFSTAPVQTAVQAAIAAAVNAVALGTATLFVSQIEAAAMSVPGVQALQPGNTKIATLSADFALTAVQIPRIAVGNVAVGTY